MVGIPFSPDPACMYLANDSPCAPACPGSWAGQAHEDGDPERRRSKETFCDALHPWLSGEPFLRQYVKPVVTRSAVRFLERLRDGISAQQIQQGWRGGLYQRP